MNNNLMHFPVFSKVIQDIIRSEVHNELVQVSITAFGLTKSCQVYF